MKPSAGRPRTNGVSGIGVGDSGRAAVRLTFFIVTPIIAATIAGTLAITMQAL